MRIIKRYSNRKLYDTTEARYITLGQMLAVIRGGAVVKVVDHESEHDLTAATLLKAMEGEAAQVGGAGVRYSPPGLHRLIREGLAA